MNLLIKFGYDGREFSGYQIGNGQNSVEDSIISILTEGGIAKELRSAARTDRSVSATGNVFMIETGERPSKVMGMLNSKGRNLCFFSYATVEKDFNPRHCDRKSYSYFVISAPPDLEATLQQFEGKHDFSNFCRHDQRNPVRTIDHIRVNRDGNSAWVTFEGRSFVWEQIRSIMGYVLSENRVGDPFVPGVIRRIVAAPEPLILNDIHYPGVEFIQSVPRAKIRKMLLERDLALLRLRFLDTQIQKISMRKYH